MKQITNDSKVYVNLTDAAKFLNLNYAKLYSKVIYDKIDKTVINSNIFFNKKSIVKSLRKMLEKSKWELTENLILEFSNYDDTIQLENDKKTEPIPIIETPIFLLDSNSDNSIIEFDKKIDPVSNKKNPIFLLDSKSNTFLSDSNKKKELPIIEKENSIIEHRNYPLLDLPKTNISPMFWERSPDVKPNVESVRLYDKPDTKPVNWLPYIPLFCVMACNAISVFICFSGETYIDTAFAAFIAVALACAVYYAASIDLIPLAALFAVIMFVIHCISFDVFHSYGFLSFDEKTFNNDFLIGLSKSISLCGLEILFSYLVNIKNEANSQLPD